MSVPWAARLQLAGSAGICGTGIGTRLCQDNAYALTVDCEIIGERARIAGREKAKQPDACNRTNSESRLELDAVIGPHVIATFSPLTLFS